MARAQALPTLQAQTLWSLDQEHPHLWHRLVRTHPWAAEFIRTFRGQIPLAPTLEPFDSAVAVRPPRHNRAFYLKQPGGAVVAVKGTEAASPELERAFAQHGSMGSRWSITEIFPLHEQKLPYAVHVPEALQEAVLTTRFLGEYLRAFDDWPPFPIHLAVYRLPDSHRQRYYQALRQFASPRSMQQCELLGQEGLAVYLYLFPSLPMRLAHCVPNTILTSGIVDAASRATVLEQRCGLDAQAALEKFLSFAGRMLALGFFPLSLASFGIGYCTSAQNVTVDGGMVDSDSLTPFSEIRSDWEFATVLLTSLSSLCVTARVMCYSPLPFVRFEFADPSTVSMLMSELVWDRIRAEVTASARRGLTIDPRLQELLAPPSYAKLFEWIARMHPPRSDWFLARHLLEGGDNRGWD